MIHTQYTPPYYGLLGPDAEEIAWGREPTVATRRAMREADEIIQARCERLGLVVEEGDDG